MNLDDPITSIEDAMAREYPPAVHSPCGDCPWRRNAIPGWLGPYSAEHWLEAVHGEVPIACHQTIPSGGGWEGALQCQGAASFRANVCKSPVNPTIARGPQDDAIFGSDAEFLEHHTA